MEILGNTEIELQTSADLKDPDTKTGKINYPDLSLFVLQSKKVDLYKGSAPKILFSFSKPQFVSDGKAEKTRTFDLLKLEAQKNEEQEKVDKSQPENIFVYRAEEPVVNLGQDLFVETRLYKILSADNNELSFYENLETNKDYYYFYYSSTKQLNRNTLKINKNTYIVDSQKRLGFQIETSGSPINRIRLVKDENFYYLEREIITQEDLLKKEYTHTFRQKIYISPKDDSFQAGFSGFRNDEYFKIRIKSKKTNKKIDLNLQYHISPVKNPTNLDKKENMEPVSDSENIKNIIDNIYKFGRIKIFNIKPDLSLSSPSPDITSVDKAPGIGSIGKTQVIADSNNINNIASTMGGKEMKSIEDMNFVPGAANPQFNKIIK